MPPWGHVTQEAVQCIAQASARYQVPELLMHAVLRKEGGRMGQAVKNRNGTYDLGLAQINTSWVEHFGRYGVTRESLQTDTCTNLYASGYILRRNFNLKRNWTDAIIAYNIGPNQWTPNRYRIGVTYARDVIRYWHEFHDQVNSKALVSRPPVTASQSGSNPATRDG